MNHCHLLVFLISSVVVESVPESATNFQDLLGQHCNSWCGTSLEPGVTSADLPRVGKAGPRGPPGVTGLPGRINMTAIELVIEQKIKSTIREFLNEPFCENIVKSRPGIRSGKYYTNHPILGITELYCDMESDGGGWTVIQRRVDGSVDFFRGWYSYKHGFGERESEFWFGLERLHIMTSSSNFELKVDMVKMDGTRVFAMYRNFKIAPESDNYRLTVTGYSGNATDCLQYHSGSPFSTKDADNDANSGNCATGASGAWWYKSCYHSNLNGDYSKQDWHGLVWRDAHNGYAKFHLRSVEMKIRQRK